MLSASLYHRQQYHYHWSSSSSRSPNTIKYLQQSMFGGAATTKDRLSFTKSLAKQKLRPSPQKPFTCLTFTATCKGLLALTYSSFSFWSRCLDGCFESKVVQFQKHKYFTFAVYFLALLPCMRQELEQTSCCQFCPKCETPVKVEER